MVARLLRSLPFALLLFFSFISGAWSGDGVQSQEKENYFWLETKCEFGAAQVAKDDQVLDLEPVVCIERFHGSRFPTVRDSSISQTACTKGGKPWVMAYLETRVISKVPVRLVLLDLENKEWLLFWREFGPETMEFVKKIGEEHPDWRPSAVERAIFENRVSFGIYHMEADSVDLPSVELGLKKPRATGEKLKQWVRDVVDILEDVEPGLLNTIRLLEDSVIYAEDPDGRYCCSELASGCLPGVFIAVDMDLLRGGGLKVARECERKRALYPQNEEAWPEFWDKFSKWDTWPEFPNMKHFKF